MSTRSSIAMIYKDGTVGAHYCHSDGYLSYNGEFLYQYYQDVNKVKELIALGDMSSLAPEVSPPEGVEHSFDDRHDGVCVFYGRDRGETNVDTQKYDSLEKYLVDGNFQEYDYIFKEKNNTWYLINHKTQKLQKLTAALMNDDEVDKNIKSMIEFEKKQKAAEKEAKQLKKELPVNKKTAETLIKM
jgi:hypothetical protein